MKDRATHMVVPDRDEAPTSQAELRIILQPDTCWRRKLRRVFVRRHPSRKR